MRGSLAKARVLYAPVEELDDEGRLLRACRIHFIVSSKRLSYVMKMIPADSFSFQFLKVIKRNLPLSFLSVFRSHCRCVC